MTSLLVEINASMSSKERRLAKRAAERENRAVSNTFPEDNHSFDAGHAAIQSHKGQNVNKAKSPLILFVGQLNFQTTSKQLEQHFIQKGGIQCPLKIRLLTNQSTGRSRGMAFVQVPNSETLYKGLSLHHTLLDGRIINVEKSAGGGIDLRKRKITDLRDEQTDYMKQTVKRIMNEFLANGLLGVDELDEDVIRVLEKFEAKVVEASLHEYCSKPDKATLRNKSAYFVYLTHQIAFNKNANLDKILEESKKNKLQNSEVLSKKKRKKDSVEKVHVSVSNSDGKAIKSVEDKIRKNAEVTVADGLNAKQRRALKREALRNVNIQSSE